MSIIVNYVDIIQTTDSNLQGLLQVGKKREKKEKRNEVTLQMHVKFCSELNQC